MRWPKVVLIVLGTLVVLAGAVVAFTPARHVSLDYATQLAERAAEVGSGTPAATVTDLTNVSQLQAAFNADVGTPRLIMLVSPT